MRAYEIKEAKLGEVERESPRPGPGEVVVRIRAASINYRDLALINGAYGVRPERPYVPLSDGAGEVAAIGAGVTRVKEGDRVVIHYILDWIAGDPTAENGRRRLGWPLDGTLAEYVRVPEHALVPLPPEVPFEDAAALPIAGTTAWHALFEFGRLRPGETVLLQGTGGVSLLALQLAKLAGARVVLTTRKPPERVKSLGADLVLDSASAWDEQVQADLVLDVIGGATLAKSLRAAAVGGRVALIGFLDSMDATLDLRAAISRRLDLRALSVGPRASLEALVRAVGHHRLRPHIERTFPFAEARAAFDAMASGAQMGKLVIRV